MAASFSASAASFGGLGQLTTNSNSRTYAVAVSDDGGTVAGYSVDPWEAFVWRDGLGITRLGSISNGWESGATHISADGLVVVGRAANPSSLNQKRAFRWIEESGMTNLGLLRTTHSSYSSASATSGDGSVIVGDGDSINGSQVPFRWKTNAFEVFQAIPGAYRGVANGISRDGRVIVGYHDSGSAYTPFIRYSNAPSKAISIAAGFISAVSHSISSDGTFVIGTAIRSNASHEAFGWSEAQAMRTLGSLFGSDSEAWGVSERGGFVVGDSCFLIAGMCSPRAFIWDSVNGMRDLNQVFANDFGLNLQGWILQRASAISSDGRTLVGMGLNPSGQTEAWRAQVDWPALDIRGSNGVVTVSWSASLTNFVLESTDHFEPPEWRRVTNSTANQMTFTNTSDSSRKFFRLRK